MRKEAIPLPLAFVLWLETELVFERLSRPEAVFAGSVLLCIWCSLRFSDAQHVRLEQFFIDFDSIRSIFISHQVEEVHAFRLHFLRSVPLAL